MTSIPPTGAPAPPCPYHSGSFLGRPLAAIAPSRNELWDRAERCGDWTRVAQGRRRLAVLRAMAGEVERGVSEREAASAAFLRAGRQREAAIELCSAADALNLVARWTGVLDLVARAWPLAVAAGDLELQVLLQSQRGRTLGRIGRVDEGLAEARAALDLAESKGLASVIGSVYQRLADCHEHGSDYVSAQATFLRGAESCVANGQAMQREACRACALPVLTQNGEWPLGLRLADEVAADTHSPAWATAAQGTGQAEAVAGLAYTMDATCSPAATSARAQSANGRNACRPPDGDTALPQPCRSGGPGRRTPTARR